MSAAGDGDLMLEFAGSGDDLACGDPEAYEAAGSDARIRSGSDFEEAEPLDVASSSQRRAGAAGQAADQESVTVRGGAGYRFVAIRAEDDSANVSYVRSGRAASGGGGGGGDDGGGEGGGGGEDPGSGDEPGTGSVDGGVGTADTGTADGSAGTTGEGAVESAADTEASVGGGDLPFTGLGLIALVVIGLALASGGAYLRRRSR